MSLNEAARMYETYRKAHAFPTAKVAVLVGFVLVGATAAGAAPLPAASPHLDTAASRDEVGTVSSPEAAGLPVGSLPPLGSRFLLNDGRLGSSSASYSGTAPGLEMEFVRGGVDIVLAGRGESGEEREPPVVHMRLVGGNPSVATVRPADLAFVSRFAGPDATASPQTAQSASRIEYLQVYPGIDLAFVASPAGLKYEFNLAAGADSTTIAVSFGGSRVGLRPNGGLDLAVGDLHLTDAPPFAIQDGAASACTWVPLDPISAGILCPQLSRDRPAVIDPLVSATYVGGPATDHAADVAVGPDGSVFVVGWTEGGMEITPGAVNSTHESSGFDAFIAKYDANLSTLLYATYLGGTGANGFDMFTAVAVDSLGRAYVTGRTEAGIYPTTSNKLQPCRCGFSADDAILTVFDQNASAVLFSTTIGGTGWEEGDAIAVDSSFNVLVAGTTKSADFPTTAGAYDANVTWNGPFAANDGFLVRVDPWNGTLLASTVLGGTGLEFVGAAGVSPSGTVFAAGTTIYYEFAPTPGAYAVPYNYRGGFVLEMSANLTTMVYLAIVGEATPSGLAPLPDGSVVVAGTTNSGVNGTAGAAYPTPQGLEDAFVLRLIPGGSNVSFVSYFGGSQRDTADDVAVDAGGGIFLTGITGSPDLPTTAGVPNATIGGGADAYIAKFAPRGDRVAFASFVGGAADDSGLGIDAASSGAACVAVETRSPDLITYARAHDPTNNSTDGTTDILAACYLFNEAPAASIAAPQSLVGFLGTPFNFSAAGSTDPDGTVLSFAWEVDGVPVGKGATLNTTFATKGPHIVTVVVSDPFGAWDNASASVTIQNRPPVASAGADSLEGRGTTVVLSANGSSDPDNDTLSFAWSQAAGPPVPMSQPTSTVFSVVMASFGNYTFCVEARDADGGSATDCRTIEVANRPPVAAITVPVDPAKRTTVVLSGDGSRDPDNEPIAYLWTQEGGPTVALFDATSANASVDLSHSGNFTFCLQVTDPAGASASACGNFTVVNHRPTLANFMPPGNQLEMQLGVPASFGLTASDQDLDPLQYSWFLDGVPLAGSSANIDVTVPTSGVHVISVIVSDGDAFVEHRWYVLVAPAQGGGFIPFAGGEASIAALALVGAAITTHRRRR